MGLNNVNRYFSPFNLNYFFGYGAKSTWIKSDFWKKPLRVPIWDLAFNRLYLRPIFDLYTFGGDADDYIVRLDVARDDGAAAD